MSENIRQGKKACMRKMNAAAEHQGLHQEDLEKYDNRHWFLYQRGPIAVPPAVMDIPHNYLIF